jgi:RND superfamily putative drug exporter
MHSNTFAARAGRWSAKNRKKAIWGWLAFVAVAFVVGQAIGTEKPSNQNDYIGQSGKAEKLFDDHFPKQSDENVLVQARAGGHATDPAVHKAVDQVVAGVSGKPGVTEVKSPFANGNGDQISKDGRSVLVKFKLNGDEDRTQKLVDPVETAVDKAKSANPAVFVGQFGDASANKAIDKSFSDDFKKAEQLSLPITLIILVFAFGALVAAGVPLLLGLSAVMATLGHALLPASRTRGKAARCREARGRPHRGRHLGASGARLRLHRHGRDGRHVLRRRPYLHRPRRRRDHGRRRGDDRLGHGRARRPGVAR